jgi:hypothetical protein
LASSARHYVNILSGTVYLHITENFKLTLYVVCSRVLNQFKNRLFLDRQINCHHTIPAEIAEKIVEKIKLQQEFRKPATWFIRPFRFLIIYYKCFNSSCANSSEFLIRVIKKQTNVWFGKSTWQL